MTAAPNIRRFDLLVVAIAYTIFIILGLPEGMLSVAWPALQETFSVTEGALGSLLLPASIAFILTSLMVGQMISRFGIAALLIAGCLIRSAGMLGYALSPAWGIIMFAAIFHGVGSGLIDAGMNTHFAVNYNERLMNWLHASFGLGATMGPLYMSAVFDLGASWRVGYALVGVAQAAIVLAIIATKSGWRIKPETLTAGSATEPAHAARGLETLRRPGVWLGVAVFFIYAGVEVTASIWGYSLFTEGRGVDPTVASRWIAIYWGMFTLGRLFFGFVAGYWPTTPMVRTVMIVAILSSIFFWWNPANLGRLRGARHAWFCHGARLPPPHVRHGATPAPASCAQRDRLSSGRCKSGHCRAAGPGRHPRRAHQHRHYWALSRLCNGADVLAA